MNRAMGRDRDFITSGLYGLLIGDALGVPYEFHDSSSIPPADQIEFEPPPGFRRSHPGVAPGTWSDDGSQALCLFESLIEHPELDLVDFAARLVRWHDEAHLQAGGGCSTSVSRRTGPWVASRKATRHISPVGERSERTETVH